MLDRSAPAASAADPPSAASGPVLPRTPRDGAEAETSTGRPAVA